MLQLTLFDENDECVQAEDDSANKETITYTRKKLNRKNKNIDTSQLPREKRLIDLSDADKQCPCGRCMESFGEESREELVFIPATLQVIEHIRLKYTCRYCEAVKMPQQPPSYCGLTAVSQGAIHCMIMRSRDQVTG